MAPYILLDSLEDPTLMIQKKSFGIAFLKKWYSLFASVLCVSGLSSTGTNASTRSYDTGLCVVLKLNHCFLVSLFKFERAFLGYR